MHFTSTLAIGAGLFSYAGAIQLRKRTDGPPRVLQLDTTRSHNHLRAANLDRLDKRDTEPLSVNLNNVDGRTYTANLTIGTPPQSIVVSLDTGSSDLWVNTPASSLCREHRNTECREWGVYSPNASSTYEYVSSDFDITYADGSGARGGYVQDVVRLGDLALKGANFGIGYESNSTVGVLGIGYIWNEGLTSVKGKTYANYPQQLKDDGVVAANAYSLYLNDLDAATGTILFGGVDKSKFEGELMTVPLIEQNPYAQFLVALTNVSSNGQTLLTEDNYVGVLLDSGSSFTYLPESIAKPLFELYNVDYDATTAANFGAGSIDCATPTNNPGATIDFTFSGSATIRVPLDEVVLLNEIQNGVGKCVFGITVTASDGVSVLGDTFLRSAYVVFDLESNEVSLAQTKFNSTASADVSEIAPGSSGVPDASLVPTPVSTALVGVTTATGIRGSQNAAVARTPAPVAVVGGWVVVAAAMGAMAV